MSSSTTEPFPTAVLTISDSCARSERKTSPAQPLPRRFRNTTSQSLPSRSLATNSVDRTEIDHIVLNARLVLTTGGTGISARDVTPEATRAVCDRLVEGIPEIMRAEGLKKTRFSALSRALCGTRGRSLILNLPGSPKGAVESLEAGGWFTTPHARLA